MQFNDYFLTLSLAQQFLIIWGLGTSFIYCVLLAIVYDSASVDIPAKSLIWPLFWPLWGIAVIIKFTRWSITETFKGIRDFLK